MSGRHRLIRNLLIAAVAILAGCAQPETVPPIYASLATAGTQLDADQALQLVNGHRKINGLGPLVLDRDLMKEAQIHAADMAANNRLGHKISRGSLKQRLTRYRPKVFAENVGAGYHTLAEAFSGWRGSPPHNKTLLLEGGQRMGIAAARAPTSKYRVFWTLIVTGN